MKYANGKTWIPKLIVLSMFLVVFSYTLLFSFDALTVSGLGNNTDNVSVSCNVSNSAPIISDVSIGEGNSTILLQMGDKVIVQCDATVNDTNGYSDISNVSAEFYASGLSIEAGDSADNRTMYKNASCDVAVRAGTSNLGDVNCTFRVWYYARNSTEWTCNLTVKDISNDVGYGNDTSQVSPLAGLEVPSTMSYGNLAAGQIGNNDSNVTNIGNIQIDIGLFGYSWYEDDGNALNCSGGGNKNITIGWEKYNITENGEYYNEMKNLTINEVVETAFDLEMKTDTILPANSSKKVYWRLLVPPGVKGTCRGTIVYTAEVG